jgi:hypothetical protein
LSTYGSREELLADYPELELEGEDIPQAIAYAAAMLVDEAVNGLRPRHERVGPCLNQKAFEPPDNRGCASPASTLPVERHFY